MADNDNLEQCPVCKTKYCRICAQPNHVGSCEGNLEQAI
jgi:hypothetical protein